MSNNKKVGGALLYVFVILAVLAIIIFLILRYYPSDIVGPVEPAVSVEEKFQCVSEEVDLLSNYCEPLAQLDVSYCGESEKCAMWVSIKKMVLDKKCDGISSQFDGLCQAFINKNAASCDSYSGDLKEFCIVLASGDDCVSEDCVVFRNLQRGIINSDLSVCTGISENFNSYLCRSLINDNVNNCYCALGD